MKKEAKNVKVLEDNEPRKVLFVRVPAWKAQEYAAMARSEGFSNLSAWVISALNKEVDFKLSKKPPR